MDHISDEYNPALPANPGIFEIFKKNMEKHRDLVKSHPPGTKFECHRCGDCCTWAYVFFKIDTSLFAQMMKIGPPQPHGHWFIVGNGMKIVMPVFSKGEIIPFSIEGDLPPSHMEWLRYTGRRHGYWRLTSMDRMVIYSPVDCIHLTKEKLCRDYKNRVKMCKDYFCGKHPKGD